MSAVEVDGSITPSQVVSVGAGARVALTDTALDRIRASRDRLERLLASGEPIYGVNTGFGALAGEKVSEEYLAELQLNLLRSHAAGVGSPLPDEIVRGAIAVRLNSLALGNSGVRPVVCERLVDLLDSDWVPVVPQTGSLGASGDLAPSAHAFLPLVGEGSVKSPDGSVVSGAEMVAAFGWEPLVLEAKEGLALINGTHFMASVASHVLERTRGLFDLSDLAAAAAVDALRGAEAAFDPRAHALRPHPGQIESAARILAAIEGSSRAHPGDDGSTQDAYSLRCAPQVHGAARDALEFFASVVERELVSVTDNPLVLEDPDQVVSAGNFHGQALASAFDTLRVAIADMASISERRTFRLVSPSTNRDLPAFLSKEPGPSSGLMIVQYTAAALVSELRALATPVSIDSVPTSDNQEDHVSMGMTAANLSMQAAERLASVLACEILCSCQAIDLDPGEPGTKVAELHSLVRESVPELHEDRPPAPDIERIVELIESGEIV